MAKFAFNMIILFIVPIAKPNNRVKRDRRNAGFGICQRLRAGPLP